MAFLRGFGPKNGLWGPSSPGPGREKPLASRLLVVARGPTLFHFKLTLVSADADTLKSVGDYLTHFGARLSSTSRLSGLADAAEASGADAVVLFADEYPPEEVRATVRTLALRLTVIVTGERGEYDSLHAESPGVVMLLPRPTWGWILLEAVRTGVARAAQRR